MRLMDDIDQNETKDTDTSRCVARVIKKYQRQKILGILYSAVTASSCAFERKLI